MPQAPVRAALIDVYDTMLVSQFEARMTDVVEPTGIPVDEWLAEFDKLREDRDRGKVTIAESFARTLAALAGEADPAAVAELVRRDAAYVTAHVRLCDDTLPFLKWLKDAGVRSVVVSNCADTTRAQLDRLGVTGLVDAMVLSCEVGLIKPEPGIYRTALDELGVAAADAVLIDDQPGYCAGAEAAGVRAVRIVRGEQDKYPQERRFPVVHSLFDAI